MYILKRHLHISTYGEKRDSLPLLSVEAVYVYKSPYLRDRVVTCRTVVEPRGTPPPHYRLLDNVFCK